MPSPTMLDYHLPMQETQETRVPSLGQEDPLEKEMAAHSSILAWEIPFTEKPGGLQSLGLQRERQEGSTEHTKSRFISTLLKEHLRNRRLY